MIFALGNARVAFSMSLSCAKSRLRLVAVGASRAIARSIRPLIASMIRSFRFGQRQPRQRDALMQDGYQAAVLVALDAHSRNAG